MDRKVQDQTMYECQDCDNTEIFHYDIEGTEEMQFHPETNELIGVELLESTAIGGPTCSECGSERVESLE